MNTCYIVRSSRPAGLFSFGLLDGLQVRLRRPYMREAQAGFGLERLATAFMNNPGWTFTGGMLFLIRRTTRPHVCVSLLRYLE